MPDDHSASRRVEILREEAPHLLGETPPTLEQALGLAVDALDFRTEWLDDYGVREYGSEQAAEMIANVTAAWKMLRDVPNVSEIRAALADLETLAADPRRDVSTLGVDLLDLHRRISTAAGIGEPREEPRTILVHINVELPTDAPATADDIADEIRAAIEIATDDSSATENMPGLTSGAWSIPLAEEV